MILIAGSSGSGKTSVAEKLDKMGYSFIPSYTTRESRPNDIGTISIPELKFGYMLSHNDFMAYYVYTTLIGQLAYGIPVKEYEENGNKSVIVMAREYYDEIYHYINNYTDDKMFMVYLEVDDLSIMAKSFDDKSRGESNKDLVDRLDRDREKNRYLRDKSSLIINNYEFRLTPQEIADIIDSQYKKFIK